MSTTKGTRPIDAKNLARRIREYMDDFPNATTRLATCRVILSMLGDEEQTPTLRPVSRERVEKVWKGGWNNINPVVLKPGVPWVCRCAKCGCPQDYRHNFCPNCGEAKTDGAVEMVMERLEALRDE